MKRFTLSIDPEILLQMLSEGKSLLEVTGGVDVEKHKQIKRVAVNPGNGTITLFYEQQELVDLPMGDAAINALNPRINMQGVPEDLDKLASELKEITNICVKNLGAPEGRHFDLVQFLRDEVAPRLEQLNEKDQNVRVN